MSAELKGNPGLWWQVSAIACGTCFLALHLSNGNSYVSQHHVQTGTIKTVGQRVLPPSVYPAAVPKVQRGLAVSAMGGAVDHLAESAARAMEGGQALNAITVCGGALFAAAAFIWAIVSLAKRQLQSSAGVLEPLLEVQAASGSSIAMATATAQPVPAKARAVTATGATKHSKIRNTLSIPEALKEYWFPVAFVTDLKEDTLIPIKLFDEDWVVFRDKEGKAACVRDECAHRACPLSLGEVQEGQVVCAYHGWKFDREGACTDMPSTSFNPAIRISSLQCREGDGFVWAWTGKGEPPAELPTWTQPPSGYSIHCEQVFEVPTEHGLLIENLLDLAHAPFTHTSTFARGWPIPDAVKFKTFKLLGGYWEPYPINMCFEPPCGCVSTIGIDKPGEIERGKRAEQCERHLWQLHVCLPSSGDKTRLLYRMALDFWGFARNVPMIDRLWKAVATQVLGEDLKLIKGQQYRMEVGGDVWANPVSYDKIGVRYRQWRNSIEDQDHKTRAKIEAELKQPFAASEMFMEGDVTSQRLPR